MPQPKSKLRAARPESTDIPAAGTGSAVAAPPEARATPVRTAVPDGPQSLSWSYSPWIDASASHRKRPIWALLVVIVAASLAGISLSWPHWWPGMLPWTFFGIVVLLAMCSTIFLPVSYKLDQRGVTVTFFLAPSFRPWEHYRNYYVHDTGVHLTTMPQPSRLDAFRGHFLQYGRGVGRAELSAFLAGHIERESAAPPPTLRSIEP